MSGSLRLVERGRLLGGGIEGDPVGVVRFDLVQNQRGAGQRLGQAAEERQDDKVEEADLGLENGAM